MEALRSLSVEKNSTTFGCPSCRTPIPLRSHEALERRPDVRLEDISKRFEVLFNAEVAKQIALERDLSSIRAKLQRADFKTLVSDLPAKADPVVRQAAKAVIDSIPAHLEGMSRLIGYSNAWIAQVKPLMVALAKAATNDDGDIFMLLAAAILERLQTYQVRAFAFVVMLLLLLVYCTGCSSSPLDVVVLLLLLFRPNSMLRRRSRSRWRTLPS